MLQGLWGDRVADLRASPAGRHEAGLAQGLEVGADAAAVSFHNPYGFKALAAIDAVSYLGRSSYWSALTDPPLAGISTINMAFVLRAQVLTVVLSVYVVATLHLAAVIVVVFFVAILVAALIWLAAS